MEKDVGAAPEIPKLRVYRFIYVTKKNLHAAVGITESLVVSWKHTTLA